jgi:hypothetical protein
MATFLSGTLAGVSANVAASRRYVGDCSRAWENDDQSGKAASRAAQAFLSRARRNHSATQKGVQPPWSIRAIRLGRPLVNAGSRKTQLLGR